MSSFMSWEWQHASLNFTFMHQVPLLLREIGCISIAIRGIRAWLRSYGYIHTKHWDVQYIPRNMHTVFALLCFVVVIHWLIFPYPSGLLHWHCGNLTIAPVPAKQPWWIWINTSCEFIMNDCITTTKQSTTKPCAYFLGYTVIAHPYPNSKYGLTRRLLKLRHGWVITCHCNQNEAAHQIMKSINVPCMSYGAAGWEHGLVFMPRNCWNWQINSVLVECFWVLEPSERRFLSYLCFLLMTSSLAITVYLDPWYRT